MTVSRRSCVAILGAGSWGVALSRVLAANRSITSIWAHLEEEADRLSATRSLEPRLPGGRIPDTTRVTNDLECALTGADVVVLAVPSAVMEDVACRCGSRGWLRGRLVISGTKGLQVGTLRTMTEVLSELWRKEGIRGLVALSGPCHAEEVVRGLPTAVVAAAEDPDLAKEAQQLLQRPEFRVYTGDDPHGTQLAGSLKNIIAIAVGISDGLGYGDNARAALVTRGLLELIRMGSALGARPETFFGLSGLGDLVVTCTSRHSRNRRMGELLAQGYAPQEAEKRVGMVVEGVQTARAIDSRRPVAEEETPIVSEVVRILFSGSEPAEAVQRLLGREQKREWHGMEEYFRRIRS